MNTRLTRPQAAVFGLTVLIAVTAGGAGLVAIGAREGFWSSAAEYTVAVPDAADVAPGTPVRVRGVQAGHVAKVEYPAADGPDAKVLLTLRLDPSFAGRVYADAAAKIESAGLLGARAVSISPGSPGTGPAPNNSIRFAPSVDIGAAADKLVRAADEAELLMREARTGNGTLGRLVRDDTLYNDLSSLAKRAGTAVDGVEKQTVDVGDTVRSVKQGTDALKRLPVVRGYVEDSTAALVRPAMRREDRYYAADDIFEPGTAILTENGKEHLERAAEWIKGCGDAAELAVAARHDPADAAQTAAAATEITRAQAAAVVGFLKAQKADKIGWWSRRPTAAVGLGAGPSPVTPAVAVAPGYLHLVVFLPQ